MGEGKGSSLVDLLVINLCLVAFGFAIAAERRRSTGTIRTDNATNSTYCVYDLDVATGYGVGAFVFLLSGESLLMEVTKCMCFGRPLAPDGNRVWTIIYFTVSLSLFDSRGKESKIGLKERGLKREKESERDLKRENERELERYEREREKDRAKREREREYKIREHECRYRARLKEWENREKEKKRTRKQEREREKYREQDRKYEILDQENDDGYNKKRKYRSSGEDREERKRRLTEKEEDMDDRIKEEEEIAEAKRKYSFFFGFFSCNCS